MQQTKSQDFTDEIARRREHNEHGYASMSVKEVQKAIREGLKRRTGKTWSVTNSRGTGYGWLRIDAPPARRTAVMQKHPDFEQERWGARDNPEYMLVDTGEKQEFGYMTQDDLDTLNEALGLDKGMSNYQGVSIPSGDNFHEEYVARAEGRTSMRFGKVYWD